jgi:hypothetical protein
MVFRIIKKISRQPLFLYLLAGFFMLHGFRENFHLIEASDIFLLFAKYLLLCFAMHGIFFFFFGENNKAALFSFVLLFIYLFFGFFSGYTKFFFLRNIFCQIPIHLISTILSCICCFYSYPEKESFS